MNGTRRLRVAIIFGGRSSEHSISCVSAGSVLAAIDRSRYEPVPVGITRGGGWVLMPDDPQRLTIKGETLPEVDPAASPVVLPADPIALAAPLAPSAVVGPGTDATRSPQMLTGIEVAFPVLHGPYGEDGTIQGMLELAGLPYVGSGVFASAAAMDKGHMKAALAGGGLEVGPYELITDLQWREHRPACLDRVARLGLPVFVKPARAGSSLGITRVTAGDGVIDAVEDARKHDPRVIVEAGFQDAREVECGVLSTESGPVASVCAEIVVGGGHDFYDFRAKYLEDAAELIVPAPLSQELLAQIQACAVRAFQALTCEGLSRVDFFITSDGRPVVNEVNTMPGFTPISMFPRMWQASGVSYPDLIDRLIQDALRRGTGLR